MHLPSGRLLPLRLVARGPGARGQEPGSTCHQGDRQGMALHGHASAFGMPDSLLAYARGTVHHRYIPLSLSIAALALVLSAQWIYSKLPRGFHQCMERTGTTLSRRGKSQAK